MDRLSRRLGLMGVFAVGIVACSSSAPTESSASGQGPMQLDGEYAASDGPIASLTFRDDTYALRPATCTDENASCVEKGTYSLNADHTELTLVSDAGGSVRYRFAARELEATGSTSSIGTRTLTGGDGDLTAGQATSLLSQRVSSFGVETPSGTASLLHVAWTVDLVEKIKLGCVCQATLGPGCKPATFAACSPLRLAYCC